jgi:hypothetical protein
MKLWIPVIILLLFSAFSGVGCNNRTETPSGESPAIIPETIIPDAGEVTLERYFFPENLKQLTDGEKDKAVAIALETREAQELFQKYGEYTTRLQWIVMYRDPSGEGCAAYQWFEYEIVETGIPIYKSPNRVINQADDENAEIYPNVHITFGDPAEYMLSVAVDMKKETAIHSDLYPGNMGPHVEIPPPEE